MKTFDSFVDRHVGLNSKDDLQQMLSTIGVGSVEELLQQVIPANIRLKKALDLPEAMSEYEYAQHIAQLAAKNRTLRSFIGMGYYPNVVPAVVSRNVFENPAWYTSYTPYQAEISQGTLHYIFEYQSMMAELTGMYVSNASMYDGSTATAEAMLMCIAAGKKANKVLLSETLDPKIVEVVNTYAHFHGVEIEMVKAKDGVTDRADYSAKIAQGGVAGMIVQQPNYYGNVEDFTGMADEAHANKALFVINSVAADLALLKTPGEWGADVAVGDGQSLGIPMTFGGPSVGYMCCTEKLIRKLPGRIVGMTKDNRGQRAFVLTLQAREQHIRRQKATSNICSNESLMALYVTIYMSLMGKEGLKEAARLSYAGAHYLAERLVATGKFEMAFPAPFFNEFCVRYNGDVDALQQKFIDNGIFGGVKVAPDTIMFAVTEKRTKEEIDKLVSLI